jgi:predicted amidohydrolase
MPYEYDLLLKGARVIDPINGLDGIFDIGITGLKIGEVSAGISPARAKRVVDLKGYTAIPGIIDSHVHASPMAGGSGAHRMLAKAGVTTAFEVAGPVDKVWEMMTEHGAGLNLACIHAIAPGLTTDNNNPTKAELRKLLNQALRQGALGLKILGGHFPLTPAATRRCMELMQQSDRYCAFHAGTTESGSNFEGFQEAIKLAEGLRLHLAHINSYCRGQIESSVKEALIAISELESHPNIFSESYLSPMNGTSGRMVNGLPFSQATPNSLKRFGYTPDYDGMKNAIKEGAANIMVEEGGETVLQTGSEAAERWESAETDMMVSFDVNPADARFLLATAQKRDGQFAVDAISTDGGGIPRNVIVELGLSLVEFRALSLASFVRKTSINPAAMLGLTQKDSLGPGTDADITILDVENKRAFITVVGGRIVMYAGHVMGSGGTALVMPEGEKFIRKTGLDVSIIDSGKLFRRPALQDC